ncbi:MAG: NUDIX domain-containing protein [Planctomycetota bacterium]
MYQVLRSNGGSRDCGRFFLDVAGQYAPEQVTVRWERSPRPAHPEIDGLIERTWREQMADARQQGRRLFNGKLCRLIDCDGDRHSLELTTGPVSYKEFVGTNLSHAYLRYTHGPEMLANALGVSAAVVTGDGFVLLGRRSEKVAYHGGRIHPLGGMLEPTDQDHEPPRPFDAVVRELQEETGLKEDSIRDAICLGLVRDKHIVQPELIFDIEVAADVAALRAGLDAAADSMEHVEVVPVRNCPSAVVNFIEAHTEDLTPVALACLLLHGMYCWGSGWFATARGYLRTMF